MDAAVSALLGVTVGGFFGFLGHWHNSRASYRRDMRRLAYEAAVAEYKSRLDFARWHVEQHPGTSMEVLPFAYYLTVQTHLFGCPIDERDIKIALAAGEEAKRHFLRKGGVPLVPPEVP